MKADILYNNEVHYCIALYYYALGKRYSEVVGTFPFIERYKFLWNDKPEVVDRQYLIEVFEELFTVNNGIVIGVSPKGERLAEHSHYSNFWFQQRSILMECIDKRYFYS